MRQRIDRIARVGVRENAHAARVRQRGDKTIVASALESQMDYWITVKNEKYPIGKFASLEDCNDFKDEITSLIKDFGLPTNDIRFQGSSLRTALANDVDIAIFITEDQVGNIRKRIIDELQKEYLVNSSINSPLIQKQIEDFEKTVKKIDEQIANGFIKNRQFGKRNNLTFMQNKYERGILPNHDLDISIIIKKQGFDTPPYLKF